MSAFAFLATCYVLVGLTASGSTLPQTWQAGQNPRVLAVSPADLAAGRVQLGDRVCVRFPGDDYWRADDGLVNGAAITYTAADVCPSCAAGVVDLRVLDATRARKLGRFPVLVTRGACTTSAAQ